MMQRSDRRAALWGLAFVAFFVAAAAVLVAAGDSGDTRSEIVAFYSSNDQLQVAGYLVGAAGFCLLPFLAGLRSLLRRADGERDELATLAFGAGLVFTAMLFLVGAAISAVATAADWGSDSYRVDANIAETVETIGVWFSGYAAVAGGVCVGAASIVALRTGALPKWLAIFGIVVAIAGFTGMMTWGFGFLAVVLWILLTSAVTLVRSREPADRAVTAAA